MRDLTKVIEAMLKHIPVEQVEFRLVLEHISKQSVYTAPEIMPHRWQDAEMAVNAALPPPDKLSDWQRKVVDIWTGKEQIIRAPRPSCTVCHGTGQHEGYSCTGCQGTGVAGGTIL